MRSLGRRRPCCARAPAMTEEERIVLCEKYLAGTGSLEERAGFAVYLAEP